MLQTRFDYEHVRSEKEYGWEEHWRNLLDGRFIITNNQLVEDKNAQIFLLGFTVEEVAEAIGHVGYTQRELEWYSSQPDRFRVEDGLYCEVQGWVDIYNAALLSEARAVKLAEIDAAVMAKQAEPFELNGHLYYSDRASIEGMFNALPLQPDDFVQQWKTAEKPDGVNNVEVPLNKDGISALASAYFTHCIAVRNNGESLKKALKKLNTIAAVLTFEVAL